MMASHRLWRRLHSDRRGAAVVEFALIAPALLMTVFGLFDLGYNIYTAELLEGAIQKAARNSGIESANSATLDGRVAAQVKNIAPRATLTFKRTSYASFSDIGRPEDFTDVNGDGHCNNGEPFEDANANGAWDADQGKSGQGGSRDAVLYEVQVTYPRPFPVMAIFGMSPNYSLTSRTVLRNQPYDLTPKPASVLNCA